VYEGKWQFDIGTLLLASTQGEPYFMLAQVPTRRDCRGKVRSNGVSNFTLKHFSVDKGQRGHWQRLQKLPPRTPRRQLLLQLLANFSAPSGNRNGLHHPLR